MDEYPDSIEGEGGASRSGGRGRVLSHSADAHQRRSGAAIGRDRGNHEGRTSRSAEWVQSSILRLFTLRQRCLRRISIVTGETSFRRLPAGCCGAACGDGEDGSASVLADSPAELPARVLTGAFFSRKGNSNFSGNSKGVCDKSINALRSPSAAGKVK